VGTWLLNKLVPDISSDVDMQWKRNHFIENIVLAGKELEVYTKSKLAATLRTPFKQTQSQDPSSSSKQQQVMAVKVHAAGPALVPMDKLPFSPSRSIASVQPEK
jgi:hypothetical protein